MKGRETHAGDRHGAPGTDSHALAHQASPSRSSNESTRDGRFTRCSFCGSSSSRTGAVAAVGIVVVLVVWIAVVCGWFECTSPVPGLLSDFLPELLLFDCKTARTHATASKETSTPNQAQTGRQAGRRGGAEQKQTDTSMHTDSRREPQEGVAGEGKNCGSANRMVNRRGDTFTEMYGWMHRNILTDTG